MTEIPDTMRAWTIQSRGSPGSVLKLEKAVPIRTLASDTSVLILVSHASLHPGSSVLMHIVPFLFRQAPYIAETDFSGTIVAVGSRVATCSLGDTDASASSTRCFPIGSKVFGSIPVPIHLKGSGALAEYLTIETDSIARVPPSVSSAGAAALPVSAITAVDVVELANLQPGYRVLINAPTGGVGSFATQLIRHAIGSKGYIVGVCSQNGAALAKELGCDETGDYANYCDGTSIYQRLSKYCREMGKFDAIVDCHGSQELWYAAERLLRDGKENVYATVGPRFPSMSYAGMLVVVWQMVRNMVTPGRMGGVRRSYKQAASFINTEKLERVRLLAEEAVIKPHIGASFVFEDAVKAYDVLLSGHSKGKVVIEVDSSS